MPKLVKNQPQLNILFLRVLESDPADLVVL